MEFAESDLGYNSFFESGRNRLGFGTIPVARVTAKLTGAYKVRNSVGEYLAKVTGTHMFKASSPEDYPAVGDWVAIAVLPGGGAVIRGILPRMTVIRRAHGDRSRTGGRREVQIIAANIDTAFIVQSVDRDYNLNRLERYIAMVRGGGVQPAIILNKTDLLSDGALNDRLSELTRRFPGIPIIPTSTVSDTGLRDVQRSLANGRTYCFLGSSGVGKSSLINLLLGGSVIRTGDISSRSGRGKHVTTRRQMYILQHGGIVIDNPGIREVGMVDVGPGLDAQFENIAMLARTCKYADCSHVHEPGCGVLRAVRSGDLDREQYLNYINIKKEAGHDVMSDSERKGKERQFGKFIKSAKKSLRDTGHKDY